ncbi:MAG TPA: amidase family protein [Chloroflexota bacterium]|nr:amidase family protein [Chloroflexota bacterium]
MDPFASASSMLAALRNRELSAVELLDDHLKRIDRLNPALNAIVTRNDAARQAAARADEARARGEERPLLGLPLTIKDTIDVARLPTTAGLRDRAGAIPDADAPLVSRLREAGAVIVGKTNAPVRAGDWQTTNPLFGRSVNPWDPARTPGGSTGGGAAAVAAGLSPLEFGSDIGGSVRIPAAFCGIFGHKASLTAISRSGHFPGSPLPNPVGLLTVRGPLARSAEDLDLALSVVAGPEPGEEVAWRLELPPARHRDLAAFCVAVLPPFDWAPVESSVLAAREQLIRELEPKVSRIAMAQPEIDWREYYALYVSLLHFGMTTDLSDEDRRRGIATVRSYDDEQFDSAAQAGVLASAAELAGWAAQRERLRLIWRRFFEEWDVLLAPVTLTNAFPHDDRRWPERRVAVDGLEVRYSLLSAYPGVATLCGLPATAFPVGLSPEGLPLSLQAIGPYLEDRTPIRFAGLTGRFQPPPAFE